MSVPTDLLRTAMAALVLDAGGRLAVRARDLAKMPDGTLSFEFPSDGAIEFVWERRAAPAPGVPNIAAAEAHNTAMVELGLSIATIDAGGRLRIGPDALTKVMAFEGALTFRTTAEGGVEFQMVRG